MSVETTNIGSIKGGERMNTSLSHHITIPSSRPFEGSRGVAPKNSWQTLYDRKSSGREMPRQSSLSQDKSISPTKLVTTNSSVPNYEKINSDKIAYLYKRPQEMARTADIKEVKQVGTPQKRELWQQPILETSKTAGTNSFKLEQIRKDLAKKVELRQSSTSLEPVQPSLQVQPDRLSIPKTGVTFLDTPWMTKNMSYATQKELEIKKTAATTLPKLDTANKYLLTLNQRTEKTQKGISPQIQEHKSMQLKELQLKMEQKLSRQPLKKNGKNIDVPEIIAERDRATDSARVAVATAIAEKLFTRYSRRGSDGIKTAEIARLMPARPGNLMSKIRRQLRLPDTEAQYDEFKTRLASFGVVKSSSELARVAIAASDSAPAVMLSREETTEPVRKIDKERATTDGQDDLRI